VSTDVLSPASGAASRLRRRARAERRWSAFTLWLGVGIIAFMVVVSFAAPLLGFVHPNQQNLTSALQSPSGAHPFGTDALGHDIFTRVIYGGRIDLTFAFVTTLVPFVLGARVGAWAG
jgi:peptide/nickel transport system permease protein